MIISDKNSTNTVLKLLVFVKLAVGGSYFTAYLRGWAFTLSQWLHKPQEDEEPCTAYRGRNGEIGLGCVQEVQIMQMKLMSNSFRQHYCFIQSIKQ